MLLRMAISSSSRLEPRRVKGLRILHLAKCRVLAALLGTYGGCSYYEMHYEQKLVARTLNERDRLAKAKMPLSVSIPFKKYEIYP